MNIRIARLDDAKRLLDIYGYYVTNTAVSFEYEIPSEEDFCGRIENTLKKYESVERLISYCDTHNLTAKQTPSAPDIPIINFFMIYTSKYFPDNSV